MARKARHSDLGLALTINVVILAISAAPWLSGETILARIDALAIRSRSQFGKREMQVFTLRKELQDLTHTVTKRLAAAKTALATRPLPPALNSPGMRTRKPGPRKKP